MAASQRRIVGVTAYGAHVSSVNQPRPLPDADQRATALGKPGTPVQAAFTDLGPPLAEVDFVVVDLETTGGSPRDCHITEVGAVRVRAGEVIGEFQSLVNPGVPVPPFIAALTGITDATLADAPAIGAVLPAFLEFAHGAVLVAHNARFDMGFLKAACDQLDMVWPDAAVVDTARLARVFLNRDEVRNNKLATLAAFFRADTTPNHRALSDARATVTVLHGLLERGAGFGVSHLTDLMQVSSRITREQRGKRTLADGLPDVPGVYMFLGPADQPLYVGKSGSIRTRVRSYFTKSEKRGRILEMVRIAARVHPIPCATDLEAHIREVRLIAEHQPPYNRKSKNPNKAVWLKLTVEPFPRLSVARKVGADIDRGAQYCGPFPSSKVAEMAREAVQQAIPLRTCSARIARSVRSPSCISADLGTCCAPCIDPAAHDQYAELAEQAATALAEPSAVVTAVRERMQQLATAEEFEAAARERERLRALLQGASKMSERLLLGSTAEIVAARADGQDWELHVIRYGRLAAAARVRPGEDPKAAVAAAVATAAHTDPPRTGETAALPEESALISAWLWQPGVRLVASSEPLTLAVDSPQRFTEAMPKPARQPRADRYSREVVPVATQEARISLAAPDDIAALARST